jgi:sec-independent protein translocase protein TatC
VDETKLPLTDHLAELRSRLFKALSTWLLATLLVYSSSERIFRFLMEPAVRALGSDRPLQAIAPAEIFFTYLKSALLFGFILSLPVVFWQAWRFVAPGLYPSEKNTVLPFVAASTLLFAGGAAFGYVAVFPLMFQFFISFDSDFVQSSWTMREVFSLTTRMLLAFGVAFELPVVVFFLSLAGIVDAPALLRGTPYAVLAIFVVAAILTPTPDWLTQLLLAVPMVLLYLLGVGVSYAFGGARQPRAELPSAVTRPGADPP